MKGAKRARWSGEVRRKVVLDAGTGVSRGGDGGLDSLEKVGR